jgi:hypothetical protein
VKATNSNLKMGEGSIPETLENLHTLKRVYAREHFIENTYVLTFEIRNFVAANMWSKIHFFYEVKLLISFKICHMLDPNVAQFNLIQPAIKT